METEQKVHEEKVEEDDQGVQRDIERRAKRERVAEATRERAKGKQKRVSLNVHPPIHHEKGCVFYAAESLQQVR